MRPLAFLGFESECDGVVLRSPVDASGLQKKSQCPVDIQLVWTNKLDTGVYTTPIIEQLLQYVIDLYCVLVWMRWSRTI